MNRDILALPCLITVSNARPSLLSRDLFEFILPDMPICDGIEACKRIRLAESKRKVQILLPSMLF